MRVPSASIPFRLNFAPLPTASTVLVSLFGAGGAFTYFDFATFSFHVPRKGSLPADCEAEARVATTMNAKTANTRCTVFSFKEGIGRKSNFQEFCGVKAGKSRNVVLIHDEQFGQVVQELASRRIGNERIVDRQHEMVGTDGLQSQQQRRQSKKAAARHIEVVVEILRDRSLQFRPELRRFVVEGSREGQFRAERGDDRINSRELERNVLAHLADDD